MCNGLAMVHTLIVQYIDGNIRELNTLCRLCLCLWDL